MYSDEFVKNFAAQFDETDSSKITFKTHFRDIEEWSSLNGLAIINMIWKKYGVNLKTEEMKMVNTVQELYDLVKSKKA